MEPLDVVIWAFSIICAAIVIFAIWSITRPTVVEFHPEPRTDALNWYEVVVVAAVNRRVQVTSDWINSIAADARATHAVSGRAAAIDVLEVAFRALDEAKGDV